MILLVVDTETDGLNTDTCRCWEIAGVLYDTKTKQVLRAWSSLIKTDEKLPRAIEQLSRIDSESLQHGIDLEEAVATLQRLEAKADCTVAHNVAFDRPILERLGFYAKRWLDTLNDVPYPEGISRKLTYLAVEHGIPVISANAHRALDDVMMVIQIIRQYDFDSEIVPYWEAERKLLSAKFRKDDFKARAVVKRFGFRWNRDCRQWEKEVRDFNGEIESVQAKLNSIADLKVKVA